MAVIQEVRLIYSDVVGNNNKYWTGILHDNGELYTEWGRVGSKGQSKSYPGSDLRTLEKKKREKLEKGYTEARIVSNGAPATIKEVATSQLKDIAKSQIETSGNPILDALIEKLVKANIHKITSSTNITFDTSTGLFSTPLGIVTMDAINEAKKLLSAIAELVEKNDFSSKGMVTSVNQYLRLIPQDAGRKLDVRNIFGGSRLIQKQNDILDSLEVSYKSATTSAPKKDDKKTVDQEKVFNVKLELASDAEIARVQKLYKKTWQSQHACRNLNVHKVYNLVLESMAEAFEIGKKVGGLMELWHGTKIANLLSIMKSGLKISPPSTAYISGKMFGNGIYFSDQSTKSLNYSFGYWDNKRESECFMFLAQVAMGKYYVPSGPYGSLPKSGYDSTYAQAGKSGVMNNEMIVYKENQCNLTHLVEFK